MKHVLYTLLLCALFQGCGSSKSVREKTDRRIMSDSLVEIKGNFERREGEIRTDSAGYIRQARQDPDRGYVRHRKTGILTNRIAPRQTDLFYRDRAS